MLNRNKFLASALAVGLMICSGPGSASAQQTKVLKEVSPYTHNGPFISEKSLQRLPQQAFQTMKAEDRNAIRADINSLGSRKTQKSDNGSTLQLINGSKMVQRSWLQMMSFNSMNEFVSYTDFAGGQDFLNFAQIWSADSDQPDFTDDYLTDQNTAYQFVGEDNDGLIGPLFNDNIQVFSDLNNSGWSEIASSSDGRSVIISYQYQTIAGQAAADNDGSLSGRSNGLVISISDQFSGETFALEPISGTTGAILPRIAVDGQDNIHVIYSFQIGHTDFGNMAYIRRDGLNGEWSEPIFFLGDKVFDLDVQGGPLRLLAHFGSYVITARGSEVAIVYVDQIHTVVARESENNGMDWDEGTVVFSPQYGALHLEEDFNDGTVATVTDTVVSPGAAVDAIYDSQGDLHVVGPVLPISRTGIQTAEDFGNDLLAYINNSDSLRSSTFYLQLGIWSRSQDDGIFPDQSVLVDAGPPGGPDGTTNDDFSRPDGRFTGARINTGGGGTAAGAGLSAFPNLGIDSQDKLYLMYTTLQVGDFEDVDNTNGNPPQFPDFSSFNRHLFVTDKVKGEDEWSPPSNITPTGSDCAYGSLANVVNDRIFYSYACSDQPGDNFSPSFPLLAFPWHEKEIYFVSIPNTFVSVEEKVREGAAELLLDVYPNPVNAASRVHFFVPQNGRVTIDLYNVLGEKVLSIYDKAIETGIHMVDLNSARLTTGAYYCTMTSNGQTVTQTVRVVK